MLIVCEESFHYSQRPPGTPQKAEEIDPIDSSTRRTLMMLIATW